jgi:hypothetical protein
MDIVIQLMLQGKSVASVKPRVPLVLEILDRMQAWAPALHKFLAFLFR